MQTSVQRDENRLGDGDRTVILARIVETIRLARAESRTWRPRWDDVEQFARVGWHAIGCSESDLRDSERAEIRHTAAIALGLTPRDPEPAQCDRCGRRAVVSLSWDGLDYSAECACGGLLR